MSSGSSGTTTRRKYLGLAGTAAVGAVAGCLGGDDGLDEDELDEIEVWIDDAFDFNQSARSELTVWLEAPDERGLETYSDIESEAFDLLTRWDDDIDPLLEDLADTSIDRTINDQTQTVEGEELRDEMEGLRDVIEDIETSAGIIVGADGDPDAVDEDDRQTIEDTTDSSQTVGETINDLWYLGQL